MQEESLDMAETPNWSFLIVSSLEVSAVVMIMAASWDGRKIHADRFTITAFLSHYLYAMTRQQIFLIQAMVETSLMPRSTTATIVMQMVSVLLRELLFHLSNCQMVLLHKPSKAAPAIGLQAKFGDRLLAQMPCLC